MNTEQTNRAQRKVILVILDGLGFDVARRVLGNIEGWVAAGEARVWKMQSVLPSTSGPCYASIHTGVLPQSHGILTNDHQFRVKEPDLFSCLSDAGLRPAAVAHSYFSTYFQDAPFEPLRDLEVNDESRTIPYARFYTMAGESKGNPVLPSDYDLASQVSILIQRYSPGYVLLHTSSPDSINHLYGPDSIETDTNSYQLDGALAHSIPGWREAGFDIMITADHGHSPRGHHGGTAPDMRDVPLYYFGSAQGPSGGTQLSQLQIAPTVLSLMGIPIPDSMQAEVFLTES
ncbi:MAG: alkaline phosphatase family protein [Pseudomonadota bacterium]